MHMHASQQESNTVSINKHPEMSTSFYMLSYFNLNVSFTSDYVPKTKNIQANQFLDHNKQCLVTISSLIFLFFLFSYYFFFKKSKSINSFSLSPLKTFFSNTYPVVVIEGSTTYSSLNLNLIKR
jgi:hypothetical protein